MRSSRKRVFCSFLYVLFLGVMLADISAFAAPPNPPNPPSPPSKRRTGIEPDQRETMILSLRSVDGYRLVELMRVFVPREHRNTEIRYSPVLHKILVRAHPSILPTLRDAAKQLDTPPSQFGVRFSFVKILSKGEVVKEPIPTEMLLALSKMFPTASGFSLVEHLYVRASNHEEAKAKVTNITTLSDPQVWFRLHQTPHPKAGILVDFQLKQNEMFQTLGRNGPDTKFFTAVHLRTRLFVAPNRFAVVGHAPLKRPGKVLEKVLVVLQIKRLPDVSAVDDADAPQANSSAYPQQIAQDPPSSLEHGVKKGAAPTSRPVARSVIPAHAKTPSPPTQPWGRHSIVRVIRKNVSFFKGCYERALKSRPTLGGRVVMSFAIQAAGNVADVAVKSTTLQDAAVETCLLRHFQTMRFPSPPQGKTIRVNYPLTFSNK